MGLPLENKVGLKTKTKLTFGGWFLSFLEEITKKKR